ncbi:hypothetical protein EU513_00440 [Yimella sp. RIT 621]|uniref:hypothetical protein n=1 Tax=Yimella sp. RIT 621 TaxID=2510323 RepID=UPI00101E063B|nr:hypothetical protein [Yimella sp. RIT 621]RYG78813.1 hypothetical protein EU513_00440 [Yimella sp. RIT 621]
MATKNAPKNSKPKKLNSPITDDQPDWPTQVKKVYSSGVIVTVNNEVWLYRRVPLGPVVSARSMKDAVDIGSPIFRACQEVEALTSRSMAKNRRMSKHNYRDIHMLLVNVPKLYVPDDKQPLKAYLAQQFSGKTVDQRLLLFGVRLRNSAFRSGWDYALQALTEAITLQNVGVQLPEYAADFKKVSAALTRAGMIEATSGQLHLADSWWNLGRNADVPYLVHSDHLHMFTAPGSLTDAARLERDKVPCSAPEWKKLRQTHTLSMSAFDTFNFNWRDINSSEVHFFPELLGAGAQAVSLRGKVEPTDITRNELRSGRRRMMADINESRSQGAMDRAEQDEKLETLRQMEDLYSGSTLSLPSIIDCSIVTALNGSRGGSYDVRGETARVKLGLLTERQEKALAEMMLGSNVRSNPNLRDLPATAAAFTGAPNLAMCGDRTGALLGFTENDKQPVYISSDAAANEDQLPMFLVAAGTGSGKLLDMSTTLPTPLGNKRVGDLKVGDEVLGRNGKITTITYLSPVNPNPDLYRITFSDGQTLDADFDHQWVVSSFKDRHRNNSGDHREAITRWEEKRAVADRVHDLAERLAADDTGASVTELHRLLDVELDALNPWSGPDAVRAALVMMDAPFVTRMQSKTATRHRTEPIVKIDPVVLWPVRELLEANISRWTTTSPGNAARWKDRIASRVAAAQSILADLDDGREETAAEIARMLRAHQGDFRQGAKAELATCGRAAGVPSRKGFREVTVPLGGHFTSQHPVNFYATTIALKSLAARLDQQLHNKPVTGVMEQRMTTGEMLAAGLKHAGTHSNFAIRLAEAIQLPEADLPLDPYILGAWLGDGTTGNGQFTSGTAGSCTDRCGVTDQEYLCRELERAGFTVGTCGVKTINVLGMRPALREAGVFADKRIPMAYLRGSYEQRLAVLQGLMDTDGSIDAEGACELTLCKQDLAHDALELIRSLGIKVAMREAEAAYTLTDPETGEKTRTVTGTRYRMAFTTNQEIFRLPRKREKLPLTVRDTQKWLYITDIQPIESVPGRCLTVADPDHVYLAGGFIPSSNTMSLLNMADQWARAGVPQIITDWKPGSDHSDTVRAAGGQCLKLSDLTSGDGVFDPLRFSHDVKAGLEYASSMLLEVSPWPEGSKKYESQLMVALDYGVKNGATCIGQALKIALDAKKASEDMVKPILDYAETSINFRACVGMDPQAEGLAVADGITYIFVGDSSLELPPMGKPATTMNQRIAAQLVRMAVFGSVMALAYRDGVCHFDEAWVLTNNSPEELDRIGRLVRQLRVLPILYTQRVSDAVNAGLTGFISRGLIMHIADREEALAACALFKLEPTEERLERITARSSLGKGTDAGEDSAGLNWNSLKALVMKSDDEGGPRIVKRGAVGIHIDLEGRAVPVVIDLPPDFLEMASTNPVDIARREAKKRLRLLSKDSAPIEATEPVIITAADEDADMFAAS